MTKYTMSLGFNLKIINVRRYDNGLSVAVEFLYSGSIYLCLYFYTATAASWWNVLRKDIGL